jgi:hypothetical protein
MSANLSLVPESLLVPGDVLLPCSASTTVSSSFVTSSPWSRGPSREDRALPVWIQKKEVSFDSFPQTDPEDPYSPSQTMTHLSASSCAGGLQEGAAWRQMVVCRFDKKLSCLGICMAEQAEGRVDTSTNKPCSCDAVQSTGVSCAPPTMTMRRTIKN